MLWFHFGDLASTPHNILSCHWDLSYWRVCEIIWPKLNVLQVFFLLWVSLRLSYYSVRVSEQCFLVCNMLLLEPKEEYEALYLLLCVGRHNMRLFVSWFRKDVIAYPRPLNSYVLLTWHFPESYRVQLPFSVRHVIPRSIIYTATSCFSSLINMVLSI